MTKKVALITGITGQDGSYLAEFLLERDYEVHGLRRRVSVYNTSRIDHLIEQANRSEIPFYLHYGDMTDGMSLMNVITSCNPDEIYNLSAQSHVGISFSQPEYTADTDALGTLRLLEAVRILGLIDQTKIYQASTSELYGLVQQVPQSEETPFHPRSPYGIAKLYAYWITKNYRESYGMFASNGILFNHESPRRGETFVTRKITIGMSRIKCGLQETLFLGNLNAKRDWGHAKDFVEAQWLILQHNEPLDLVIATGVQYSIKQFVNEVAKVMGMELDWEGQGHQEKAYWRNKPIGAPNEPVIAVDSKYFRPSEVDTLLGDASKANSILGWKPKISFETLVKEMAEADLRDVKRQMQEI